MEAVEPMSASWTLERALLYNDLDALDAFFALPHVQREVRETDVADTSPRDLWTCTRRAGSRPWFRRDDCTNPVETAMLRNDATLLEWCFSRERAKWMPATLALLLLRLARVDDKRHRHYPRLTNATAVIEALLASYVFQYVLSDDEQQHLLDDMVTYSRSEAHVCAAIAHGGRVDRRETVEALAKYDYQEYFIVFGLLVDAGLTLVGADVLHLVAHDVIVEWVEPLSACGVDWGNATNKPLILLAESLSLTWGDMPLDYFVRYANSFQDSTSVVRTASRRS